MAIADADEDTQTQTPPPAAPATVSPDLLAQLPALIQRLGLMPQPVQQDTTPVSRSGISLLGEALAGGAPVAGMSDADKETAGTRALMNFSTGLMAASRYQPGQTIFSNLAQGFQGAQRGEIGAEEMAMAKLGAQQEYAQQQGQNKLEAIKAALPFLTLKTQMDQAAAARNLAGGGGGPPAPNVAQGGSISGNTYEGAIAGHEGLTADKNLPTTVGGFIPSTWQAFATANPDLFKGMSPDQVAAARSDPKLNAAGITWLAQNNAPVLTKYGAPVTGQSLGIAHYLGAEPTAGVMAASDNTPVRNFVSDAAVKANPELATLTVGQLKQRYANVPAPGFLTATKTAATPPAANAAPPGVQMGGAPPAPPGGAPGAAAAPYTGGGIGAVLAPGGAANPVVTKGTPIPGRVASDVGAIRGGMDLAQIKPDVTALTAGPGAPTATASAAHAAPQPGGWGSTVGSYSFGPASASAPPTVTPPAQPTPTTPPTTPPTAQPNPDIKIGDLTIRHPGPFADYRASQYVPPTGEDFNPNLTPAQMAAFAARRSQVDFDRQNIANLPFAQQPEAVAKWKAEDAALTADQQNAAQAKTQAAAAATTKYNETQQKDIQTRYDAATAAYNTAAGNEQTTQGKLRELAQQGEQAQTLARINAGTELEKGDADQGRKDIEALNTNAMAASNMQSLLGMIGPNLKDLPSATVGAMLQDHPGAIPFLTKLHLLDGPTANATQLLQGLTAFMAAEMKPKGLGPLRIQEMNAFQGALPGLLQSDEGRQKMFAFMNAYSQRIIDEADYAQKYFTRDKPNPAPGSPPGSMVPTRNTYGLWSQMGKPTDQGGLGSVLPMYTGDMKTADDAAKYSSWEQQQQTQPGHAYWGLRKGADGQRHMELQITPPAGG